MVEKAVFELDTTKTYSGLPAPEGWYISDTWGDGLVWDRWQGQRIRVIEDITVKSDGRKWLHVSISKSNRKMPTYEDVQEARRLFIGEHRECYHVYPTADRYVNFAHVLHLWCCLDAPTGVLPRFEGDIPAVINGEVTTVKSV